MSVIEDTRKLLQDFLAPELRELTARVEALEVKMDMRFDAMDDRQEARFKEVDARFGALGEQIEAGSREVSTRFDSLSDRLDGRFLEVDARFKAAEVLASERHSQTIQSINRLADIYELRERITRIEARERAS